MAMVKAGFVTVERLESERDKSRHTLELPCEQKRLSEAATLIRSSSLLNLLFPAHQAKLLYAHPDMFRGG